MQIWKTKTFRNWQKKTDISNERLMFAVTEMSKGLIDAELGAHLVKKRIAKEGAGKRSGYRTLIATNKNDKWFFIYGFEKNEMDNINLQELLGLKDLADYLLNLSKEEIQRSIKKRVLMEVKQDE